MRKLALARKIVRTHSLESVAAADQMDRVVNQIVRALKRGEEAHLPGLGTLIPGKDWVLLQEPGKQEPDER